MLLRFLCGEHAHDSIAAVRELGYLVLAAAAALRGGAQQHPLQDRGHRLCLEV